MSFYDLSRYFIVYAFFGWCIEVAYAAVKKGEFVNRGFLNGPVCPDIRLWYADRPSCPVRT